MPVNLPPATPVDEYDMRYGFGPFVAAACLSTMPSPASRGVVTGKRRALVACSKLYASEISVPSLHARPKNEMPSGRRSSLNPAGTVRSGKPVRFAKFVALAPPPPALDAPLDVQQIPQFACELRYLLNRHRETLASARIFDHSHTPVGEWGCE